MQTDVVLLLIQHEKFLVFTTAEASKTKRKFWFSVVTVKASKNQNFGFHYGRS